jgi:class 3 adenylate cyclase/tetratricopeptide (TPR) repeat protein
MSLSHRRLVAMARARPSWAEQLAGDPRKCPRCQRHNFAGQKFCGECGERLSALCSSCGASNPTWQRFCGDCGTPLAPATAASKLGLPETSSPKRLVERIFTSKDALEGERKQVTVLFADVKGSMELLTERDPEEARTLLDPVLERMMEAIHRYEGTVNQVMGDGIMAIFGAPRALEDHAVRACYAALRMQEAVRRYSEAIRQTAGVPISIRVGLNSGDVVVRSIESGLHTDYSAVGQTTHLAARMEQAAPPGSICLTSNTCRLADGFVAVRPIGPVVVKGLREPVETFELYGAGASHTRLQAAAARGLTRFVGRDRELEALHHALEKARAGHGQVVTLVGDAGVGKSRLVWELTHSERTHGWRVLETTFTSYDQAIPFSGVVELLKVHFKLEPWDDGGRIYEKITSAVRAGGDALKDTAPPLLGLLEALPSTDAFHALDPPERRARTLLAVKKLLLHESYGQPLLLVLEDVQWADSDTVRCLDTMMGNLPGARICIVITHRTGYECRWATKSEYTQLRIDPLPPRTVESLLETMLGQDARLDPLRQFLVERTEGNPFFLEESVRMLEDTGVLAGTRGAHALAGGMPNVRVPGTVQAVLASRIDGLPAQAKRLLQSAAVIGKDVPFDLLRAIAGLPAHEIQASLAQLQSAEFLYEARLFPEPEYAFRHGLTHEVAYASLVLERRRELHAKALNAMENLYADHLTDHVDVLARHALGGEVWDKAVDYLRGSGSRAYRRGALRKALDRYEHALKLLPNLPAGAENVRRGIDVRLDLHAPLFSLGQIQRLTQLHQEARCLARDLDDKPRLGSVLSRLGIYSFADASYAKGIKDAEQALAIAEGTGDLELDIVSRYLLGINHGGLGNVAPHVEFLRWIVDGPHAELSMRVIGLSASPYVLACGWLASVFSWLGDFPRAQSYAERGIRAADESDHPYAQAIAYTWQSIPVAYRGDFAAALPLCEVGVQLCENKELLGWLPFAYALRGWILSWAGRPAEGLPLIERAVNLFETVGIKAFMSLHYIEWAEALLLSNSIADARRVATRAVELAELQGERGCETWARCLLGDIALAAVDTDAPVARSFYQAAKTQAEEMGLSLLQARCQLGLGRTALVEHYPVDARMHLTAAGRFYRQVGSQYWLARVEDAMAQLGCA